MKLPKLTVVIEKEGKWYVATCPELIETRICSVRQTGSHIIMRRRSPTRTITVPIPNHSEIARGTLKSIVEQSELPKSEFMGGS